LSAASEGTSAPFYQVEIMATDGSRQDLAIDASTGEVMKLVPTQYPKQPAIGSSYGIQKQKVATAKARLTISAGGRWPAPPEGGGLGCLTMPARRNAYAVREHYDAIDRLHGDLRRARSMS
jgi:hypothetical protein